MTTKRTAEAPQKKKAPAARRADRVFKVKHIRKRTAEPAPTCLECGGSMERTRGPHRYTVEGGWSVLLENAEKLTCLGCREESVVIDAPGKLQRAIAAGVVAKEGRLSREEIVFLRRYVNLAAQALARVLGVTPGTVSRWENGHEPIGATPDRLLRALVMLYNHTDVDFSRFEKIGDDARPARITLRFDEIDGDWHLPSSA